MDSAPRTVDGGLETAEGRGGGCFSPVNNVELLAAGGLLRAPFQSFFQSLSDSFDLYLDYGLQSHGREKVAKWLVGYSVLH
jgi:hypothetical protein